MVKPPCSQHGSTRYEQTMQTQIRLLQQEQSDQSLQCLLFHLHLLDALLLVEPPCLTFRIITPNFSGVRFFRKFMVIISSTQFFNFMVYYVECSVRLSALGIMGRIRDLSSTAIYQPVSDKCFTTIHISSGKVKIWLQNSITCILIHQRSLKNSATLRNSTITPLQ